MQEPHPLEDLTQPVTLPCGHNFELDDLQGRMQTGETGCPECGKPIGVEPGDLQVNVQVQQLLSELTRLRGCLQHGTNGSAPLGTPHSQGASRTPTGGTHQGGTSGEDAAADGDQNASAAAAALLSAASSTDAAKEAARLNPVAIGDLKLGRDTPAVTENMAAYFAKQIEEISASAGVPVSELPVTTTRRVMKQDTVEARLVSEDATKLMTFGIEVFVGFLTDLAWKTSTHPNRRNTVDQRDMQRAVAATSKLDFLLPSVGGLLDSEGEAISAFNEKQEARMNTFRAEKARALRVFGVADGARGNDSRRKHAMRRQRGLRGRFLARGEADAVALLTSGAMADVPAIPPAMPEGAAAEGGTSALPPPGSSPPPTGASEASPAPVSSAENGRRAASPASGSLHSKLDADASLEITPAPSSMDPPLKAVVSATSDLESTEMHYVGPASHSAADSQGRNQPRSYTRLPLANVARIMSRTLPAGSRISQEAKECMCDLAGELSSFVTMEASCWHSRTSKAVTPATLMFAYSRLDLDGFIPSLRLWLEKAGKLKTSENDEAVSSVANMGLLGAATIVDSAATITSILFDGDAEGDNGAPAENDDMDEDEDEGEAQEDAAPARRGKRKLQAS